MPKTSLEGKDNLSGILKPVSVNGKVYCRSEFSAPWSVSFEKKNDAIFHMIEEGKCFLIYSKQQDPIELNHGDFVIFPNGSAHVLSDSPKTLSVPFLKILRGLKGPAPLVKYGGGGEQTKLVCGTFKLEAGKDNALLRILPEVMYVRASGLSQKCLLGALDLLSHEARDYGDGSALTINNLVNLIFIQAIRRWVKEQSKNQSGLLGALQDRRIAAVLTAIHNDPQKDWDLLSFSRIAGMSRSSFASQFSSLIGQPPLSYLSYWRMQIAAQLIRQQLGMNMSEISQKVGYLSEHAFSKAFKRYHGVSPSQFRIQVATR
jgi:AraC-like DNA-binding protein